MKSKIKRPIFREIPLKQIEEDQFQPRGKKNFGEQEKKEEFDKDLERLRLSIEKYGVGQPLSVNQIEKDRYVLIEGHRRFRCLKELEEETAPCLVYDHLTPGEFASLQYELQNIRRPWKPLDRAKSFTRIREDGKFKSIEDLANHLNLSKTLVANALQLYRYNFDYLELMQKYDLQPSYRMEFIRLQRKLRKIHEFEVDHIAKILFEKVRNDVISNAKDFRKLREIFLRAATNEEMIYQFLANPDTTIAELEKGAVQSALSLASEQMTKLLSERMSNAMIAVPREKEQLLQISELIEHFLKISFP